MKSLPVSFITLLLIVQQSAISQNYALPFKGEDFKPGERVFTGNHGAGIQGEGEDIGNMRYLGNNKWSHFKDGANGTKNTDFVIYERPIYAMAAGKIIGCWSNAPENDRPILSTDTELGQEWLHPKLKSKELPGGGNMLWIQHADGSKALYAHMIPGTITSNLCPNTEAYFPKPLKELPGGQWEHEDMYVDVPAAKQVNIAKGQFLGNAGNSGSSSAPHLHIHIEKSGMPAKMRFEEGSVKNYVHDNTDIQNAWSSFATQEIPDGEVLIRPARSVKYRMVDFETFESGSSRTYAGIFEPASYSPVAVVKSSWAEFLKAWQDVESKGSRMKDFESYLSGGTRMYSGIFEPGSYSPVALFKNNWNEFLTGWQTIESQGNRMIDFESYETGGRQMYVGIFKPGTYSPVALFKNSWNEFLTGWQAIEAKGSRMIDFEFYEAGGKQVYVGIFKPGNYAPVALFKNNWDDFVKGWKDIETKGNRMLDFETYEVSGRRMYVGIFKPGTYTPAALLNNNWDNFLEGWQNLE